MGLARTLPLLPLLAGLWTCAGVSALDAWPIDFTLAQAQAAAGCLKYYATHLAPGQYGSDSSNLLDKCSSSADCKSCLSGAKMHPRLANCSADCRDTGCKIGCNRLREAASSRPGVCPKPTDPRDDACRLHTACSSDADCMYRSGDKCCHIGVCRICQQPEPQPPLKPPLPAQPRPEPRSGSPPWFAWNVSSHSREDWPLVFALQARFMMGPTFDAENATQWLNLKFVSATALELNDLRPGYFWQLRVAAVSSRGSSGFGPPSSPAAQPTDPQPPMAPVNLTEGLVRVLSSGGVSVTIHWRPPPPADLPLNGYEVSVVQLHKIVQADGRLAETVTRSSHEQPASVGSFVIQNLRLDTSYKVQVTAKSLWGGETLRSKPNTIYVTTPKLGFDSASGGAGRDGCDEGGLKRLDVLTPMYENGSVSVKVLILGVFVSDEETLYRVRWRRRVCIGNSGYGREHSMNVVAQKGYFTLTKLHFNCRYTVSVQPQDRSISAEASAASCFSVPSCAKVRLARDAEPPDCRRADDSLLPGEPQGIQVQLLGEQAATGLLAYRVSWRRPRRLRPPVSGYSVEWGPRLPEPVSRELYGSSGLFPQLDADRAVSRVLPAGSTSLLLPRLRRGSLYIVRLRSHSVSGGSVRSSAERSYYFATEGRSRPPNEADSAAFASGEVRKYVRIGAPPSCRGSVAMTTGLLALSLAAVRQPPIR